MRENSQDLLVEVGSEELPPKSLKSLSEAFTELVFKGLLDAGLVEASGRRQSFATPRRLAVWVEGVRECQEDKEIERVGPPLKAAVDGEGKPNKVGLGFARSLQVAFEKLDRKETSRGPCLYYKSTKKGHALEELLGGIIEAALLKLPIKKHMRWGDKKESFVRPVKWLLTLWGERPLEIEAMGLKSSSFTYGHRFHAKEPLAVTAAKDYEEILETKGRVIPCFAKRTQKVLAQVKKASEGKGAADIDESLLEEVSALVEWPVGLLGRFDESFLSVPAECLMSSMKEHQKYFPVLKEDGSLAPYFVLLANIESSDPEVIIEGNEKVITPRLKDAAFFFDNDKKRGLSYFNEQLKKAVFQKELGTIYEKAVRVSKLAALLAGPLGGDKEQCAKAGLFCKADLASDMVFEFTDLQGTMGRYYALHEGFDEDFALALKEHYKPEFSGDTLPSGKTGASVALADKIDTICGLFGIGKPPTGSKDPYSLRRAAIGVLRIVVEKNLDLNLTEVFKEAGFLYGDKLTNKKAYQDAADFVMSRFPAKYKEEGVRQDSVAAVSAVCLDSPFDFDRRLRAVEDFRSMPEALSLTMANKRVKNILKDQDTSVIAAAKSDLNEESEKKLASALSHHESHIGPILEKGDYTAALKALSSLKPTLDTFFDEVKVMADEEKVRLGRLNLLHRLSQLFLRVADISRLQS